MGFAGLHFFSLCSTVVYTVSISLLHLQIMIMNIMRKYCACVISAMDVCNSSYPLFI